jgi:hypothetical protein
VTPTPPSIPHHRPSPPHRRRRRRPRPRASTRPARVVARAFIFIIIINQSNQINQIDQINALCTHVGYTHTRVHARTHAHASDAHPRVRVCGTGRTRTPIQPSIRTHGCMHPLCRVCRGTSQPMPLDQNNERNTKKPKKKSSRTMRARWFWIRRRVFVVRGAGRVVCPFWYTLSVCVNSLCHVTTRGILIQFNSFQFNSFHFMESCARRRA